MDKLLPTFRQYSHLSPVEVINALYNDGLITITKFSHGRFNHSTTVTIGSHESFTITDQSDVFATEKAAKLAYDYLNNAIKAQNISPIERLSKPLIIFEEQSDSNSTGLSNICPTSSTKDVTENESYKVDFLDKLSNTEASRFLYNFKKQPGFAINYFSTVNRATLEPIYHSTIVIPNVGQFTATSTQSKCDSLAAAVGKLRAHLDKLSLETVLNNETNSQCIQNNHIDSTNEDENPLNQKTASPTLASHNFSTFQIVTNDYRRMDLINQFISVYASTSSPTMIIKRLIKKAPKYFKISTKTFQNYEVDQLYYKTTLNVYRLASFTLGSFDEKESFKKVAQAAFDCMRKLTLLLLTFKSSYYTEKSPSSIIEELHNKFSNMIRFRVRQTAGFYRVSILTLYCTEFQGCDLSESEAKLQASIKLFQYLKFLSDQIRDGPHLLGIKNSFEELDLLSSLAKETPIDSSPSPAESSLTKIIDLLNRFNSVYSITKTPHDILRELKASSLDNNDINDDIGIDVNTEATSDQSTFITKIKIENITSEFIAYDTTEEESVNKVELKCVEFLTKFSKLVSEFKAVYSPSKASPKIIDQLLAGNREILKVSTTRNRTADQSQQYLTVIQLMHVCSFSKTAPNQFASHQAASQCIVHYLRKLGEGVLIQHSSN